MQGNQAGMPPPPAGEPIPPQPGMPVAQPPPMKPVGPKPSNGMITTLVFVAAFMLFLGMIVLQIRPLIDVPTSGPEYQDWQRLMRYMAFIGAVLLDIGAFLLLFIGPYVGILRQDMPDRVRRSLIGMSTIIGVAWLIASFFMVGGGSPIP